MAALTPKETAVLLTRERWENAGNSYGKVLSQLSATAAQTSMALVTVVTGTWTCDVELLDRKTQRL